MISTFESVMTIYPIKVSIIFIIFHFSYIILFSKEMNFYANRIYLISEMVISLLLPFLRFEVFPKYILEQKIEYSSYYPPIISELHSQISEPDYLLHIYLTGVVISILIFIKDIVNLIFKIFKSKSINYRNYKLIISKDVNQFSFFRYIFIHENYDQSVLEHEIVHSRQFHSIDLIIAAFFRSIIWFNPFVYRLNFLIKMNHEYICDSEIVKKIGILNYSDSLLNQIRSYSNLSVVNYYYSFIKNRIIMMKKINISEKSSKTYLFMIPFFIGIITIFSFKSYMVPVFADKNKKTEKSILENDTIKPNNQNNKSKHRINKSKNYVVIYDTLTYKDGRTEIISNEIPYKFYVNNYDKINKMTDTVVFFDPDYQEEIIKVVETEVNAVKSFLVGNEFLKPQPNKDLIEKWYNEGNARKYPEPSSLKKVKKLTSPEWNEFKYVNSFDNINREYSILKTINLNDFKEKSIKDLEKVINRECVKLGCSIIVWNKKKPEKLNNNAYLIK